MNFIHKMRPVRCLTVWPRTMLCAKQSKASEYALIGNRALQLNLSHHIHAHTPNMGRTDTIGPDNYLSRKSESTISFYCLRPLPYMMYTVCAAYLTVDVRNSIDCCLGMCVIRHVMTDDWWPPPFSNIVNWSGPHAAYVFTAERFRHIGFVWRCCFAIAMKWIKIIRTWLRCRSILYLIRIWYPMN